MIVVNPAGDSFDVVHGVGSLHTPTEFVAVGRGAGWASLARRTVEEHPWCACCRAEQDLQVHHVKPYHLWPELELDKENLIVLCRRCHLFVGHLGRWDSWNSMVRDDAEWWLMRIDNRPTSEGGT